MKARLTKNEGLALRRLVAAAPDVAEIDGRQFFLFSRYHGTMRRWRGYNEDRLAALAFQLVAYHGFSYPRIRAIVRWQPEKPPLHSSLIAIQTKKPWPEGRPAMVFAGDR